MSMIRDSEINRYLDRYDIGHANKGYRYLMTGIRLLLEEKATRSEIMELYRLIGDQHSVSSVIVERCIRSTLKASKAKGTTNRDFMAKALDTLIFDEDDRKEGESYDD